MLFSIAGSGGNMPYRQKLKQQSSELVLPPAGKDTFMVSGLTFRIIDYKSGRSLNASIKNSQIQILSGGVQYFQYRVIYYVFSSLDDENMPVIRHFDQRLSFPVLNALKLAAIGSQYIFEEIIVVDPSGIKLSNEVRSILIERIE